MPSGKHLTEKAAIVHLITNTVLVHQFNQKLENSLGVAKGTPQKATFVRKIKGVS